MKVIGNTIRDRRINSSNYMLELSLKEYYDLSKDILKNNEYQRRRVKSSSTVYSLLREDLKRGCLMPPIVLALATSGIDKEADLISFIQKSRSRLIILDGLQRSYTIKGLIEDIIKNGDVNSEDVFNNIIRVEIYVGINKLGILYRMLTLNTGQTPMSTRHQIEIIYSDYMGAEIEGVRLLRETDDIAPQKLGEYRFNDIIEGFTSFIQRNYLTLERTDILDSIKSLEKISIGSDTSRLFEQFVSGYHYFVKKLNNVLPGRILSDVEEEELSSVFGGDVVSIFKKSQPLTGFGAAIGKLMDLDCLKSIENIPDIVDQIDEKTIEEGLTTMLKNLSHIRDVAKKIGNDQRLYFRFFFRSLFDKEAEEYGNMNLAARKAYQSYERETM
jgi:hypothetical protein